MFPSSANLVQTCRQRSGSYTDLQCAINELNFIQLTMTLLCSFLTSADFSLYFSLRLLSPSSARRCRALLHD